MSENLAAISFRLDESVAASFAEILDFSAFREALATTFHQEVRRLPLTKTKHLLMDRAGSIKMATALVCEAEDLAISLTGLRSDDEFLDKFGFVPNMHATIYLKYNDTENNVAQNFIIILEEVGKNVKSEIDSDCSIYFIESTYTFN